MTIAKGVFKTTRIKRQSAKGSLAGATLGQILRREKSVFELAKETYTTESEITSVQQVKSSRHGVRIVNGSIDGILSPGTYSDPLSAILRRDFAAVTAITAMSITVAGAGPTFTVTRAAGDFLTGGIKVGMVVRLTAGSFNAANLNKNLLVISVTALVVTVMPLNGVALFAEGPIASSTMSVPGKVTYAENTGHTNIYHTVEEWYPDTSVSERNIDVKFLKADVAIPGSGNATIKFGATGLDQTRDVTAYFTSPAAETTSDVLTAASGLLIVNGTAIAVVTDLSFTLDGKGDPAKPVVGANIRPDVFTGNLNVSGSFTAYFESGTLPDLFLNETATSLVSALSSNTTAAAEFISWSMSNVRLNSATPDDNQTGLTRTYSFVALYNGSGGAALANQATAIQVQDSLAA